MDNPRGMEASGPFEARYLAFLETITQLRPRLHRYCSRMTGSVMDGEDVVQDALFEAYRKLDQYDDSRPLTPWLFRIAHNRCIDFLRRRGVRIEAETAAMSPDSVMPANASVLGVGRAVEQLVMGKNEPNSPNAPLPKHSLKSDPFLKSRHGATIPGDAWLHARFSEPRN